MFKYKAVHECTWYQAILGQRMMINFVVISSDLGDEISRGVN